jgi:hypothetical protein
MPADPQSLHYLVLTYAVSEPGDWTLATIEEDLPNPEPGLRQAAEELVQVGMMHINSYDGRLWPLKAGRDLLRRAS